MLARFLFFAVAIREKGTCMAPISVIFIEQAWSIIMNYYLIIKFKVFFTFIDRDEVEDSKIAEKTRSISSHLYLTFGPITLYLDRTSLVNSELTQQNGRGKKAENLV